MRRIQFIIERDVKAQTALIPEIQQLADSEKEALGFLPSTAFGEAIEEVGSSSPSHRTEMFERSPVSFSTAGYTPTLKSSRLQPLLHFDARERHQH